MNKVVTKLLVVFAVLGLTQTAFAAPIFCSQDGNKFRVEVSNTWHNAKVFEQDQIAPFGELVCDHNINEKDVFLDCVSRGVVDNGFLVKFYKDANSTDISVELAKVSFRGAESLGHLPCAAALNANHAL